MGNGVLFLPFGGHLYDFFLPNEGFLINFFVLVQVLVVDTNAGFGVFGGILEVREDNLVDNSLPLCPFRHRQ